MEEHLADKGPDISPRRRQRSKTELKEAECWTKIDDQPAE